MRITKISVKGLFGMFDHEIPLNQDERITIVHGPNGVGKTVTMQMVHGLFHYEYQWLGSIPFNLLRIEFDSGDFVTVEKANTAEQLFLAYVDTSGTRSEIYYTPPSDSYLDVTLAEAIEDELPEYKHFNFGETSYWADIFYPSDIDVVQALLDNDTEALKSYGRRTRFDLLTEHEVLQKYPPIHDKVFGKMPDWFARIRQTVNTTVIQTQRLRTDKLSASELAEIINDWNMGEMSFLSPGDAVTVLNSDVLKDKDANLEEIERRLIEIATEYAVQNIEELRLEKLGLIDYIIEDVLDANLFVDILNERLLFKSASLVRGKGFTITGRDGSVIPLTALSSGEQHLLVLYYQLLFEIEPDTLVMIDEPELSMNVVWQRNFLKDLQRIIELRKFDVLIATHSPEIIYDKWDWVVHLSEKVDD